MPILCRAGLPSFESVNGQKQSCCILLSSGRRPQLPFFRIKAAHRRRDSGRGYLSTRLTALLRRWQRSDPEAQQKGPTDQKATATSQQEAKTRFAPTDARHPFRSKYSIGKTAGRPFVIHSADAGKRITKPGDGSHEEDAKAELSPASVWTGCDMRHVNPLIACLRMQQLERACGSWWFGKLSARALESFASESCVEMPPGRLPTASEWKTPFLPTDCFLTAPVQHIVSCTIRRMLD